MGQHRANKQTHTCVWSKFGMDTKVTYKGKFQLVVIKFPNKNLKEKEKL